MPSRYFLVVVAAWISSVSPGRAQSAAAQDPAALVPAKVLAYAELRQPAPFAKEIAAVLADSQLGRTHEIVVRARTQLDPHQPRPAHSAITAFGLLLAPEMLREFQRLGSLAIALIGFDVTGSPQFLGIVYPGDSNGPTFFLRALLASESPFAIVADVEGVPIYQEVHQARPPGQPAIQRADPRRPAIAMLPDVLLVGSTEAVKEAVRRAKGKAAGPALASLEAFREARAEVGTKPGFFTFVDLPTVLDQGGPHLVRAAHLPEEAAKAVQKFIQPKAFRWLAGNLTLEGNTLQHRLVARLQPGAASPFLEILPSGPMPGELMRLVPPGALAVAGGANHDAEKRLAKLMEWADNLVKSYGQENQLPSHYLEQFEVLILRAKVGKDLLGRVAGAALLVSDPLADPKAKPGREPAVTILLQATDESAAKALLEEMVPRIFGMTLGLPDLQPSAQQVNGVTLFTAGKEGRGELHYGRVGKVLVLGPSKAAVLATLGDSPSKRGQITDAKARQGTQLAAQEGVLAVVLSDPLPILFLKSFLMERRGTATAKPAQELAALARISERTEPFVLRVQRQPQRIVVEAQQPGLAPMLARAIDFALELALAPPPPTAPK